MSKYNLCEKKQLKKQTNLHRRLMGTKITQKLVGTAGTSIQITQKLVGTAGTSILLLIHSLQFTTSTHFPK